MKRIQSIITLLSISAAVAFAQEGAPIPKVEAGVSFSAINIHPGGGPEAFTMSGGSGTLVYNFTGMFSAVAELGGYHNIHDGNYDPTAFNYLFGPRVNFRRSRITPYVQTLFGGMRVATSFVDPTSGTGSPSNGFAMALGAGLDVKVRNHIVLKPAQLDYLMTRVDNPWSPNHSQNNLRYSGGVVFTFGSR